MKILFKNQLQFYALPAPEQRTILPVSMRKTGFDLWEGLLVTAFPLQALTEFFIGNCSYFELNAGVEGFEEIKRQICGELYKACFPLRESLDWEAKLPICKTWTASELAVCPFWQMLRDKAKEALLLHGWEQTKPEMNFWELMQ